MAKTKEELNELKKEYEVLSNKLEELSDDELNMVTGGNGWLDILKKIGEGMSQVTKPVLNSSNVTSPEEVLGGKIPVTPNNNK